MTGDEDLSPGRAFGLVVSNYQSFRPPYPSATFDAIVDALGRGCCHRAIDLGAGTGLATQHLCKRFVEVTAVEPDPVMANTLAGLEPNLDVVVAPAEQADFSVGSIDLVSAAMSFHWMDRDLVAQKVHDWLAPHGIFAVSDRPTILGRPKDRFPEARVVGEFFDAEIDDRWSQYSSYKRDPRRHGEVLRQHGGFEIEIRKIPLFFNLTFDELTGYAASTSSGAAYARFTGDVDAYWQDYRTRLGALGCSEPVKTDFSVETILARKV